METIKHLVAPELCKGDGICVEVCSKGVLELADGKARTVSGREQLCSSCGQCVAVCPTEALSVEGRSIGQLEKRASFGFDYPAFRSFLLSRRSTRVFADKPVDRGLVEKVIEAAAAAPPGFPPHTTEILVIDQKEELAHLAKSLREGYAKLIKLFANPVARTVIRLKRGEETVHSLKSHVLGIVRENNAWFDRNGGDRYLYGAPVLLLFHAHRRKVCYDENGLLAACYAMLGAHALGLGATILSIVPPIINNMGDELRKRWAIPKDNVVVSSMILGHPKYKYRRVVRRELAGVRFLDAG